MKISKRLISIMVTLLLLISNFQASLIVHANENNEETTTLTEIVDDEVEDTKEFKDNEEFEEDTEQIKESNQVENQVENEIEETLPGLDLEENTDFDLINESYPVMPILKANADSNGIIAHFTFDEDLSDDSVNNIEAVMVGITDDNVIHDGYLDLTNTNSYLSVPGSILSDLNEMTVEMRVKTGPRPAYGTYRDYWAFYAAPNGNGPTYQQEKYIGIILNGEDTTDAMVSRFANTGWRPEQPTTRWTADEWHTVRVVFETKSTHLYIDGKRMSYSRSDYALTSCFGGNEADNSRVLWFGHSPWEGGQGFNGIIDEITIWNKAYHVDIPSPDSHIVTKQVTDPENTIVNFFDYWLTNQADDDYQAMGNSNDVINGLINKNHAFLFAGYYGMYGSVADDANYGNRVGIWNAWTGNGPAWNRPEIKPDDSTNTWYKPYIGIVQNMLVDKFPKLNPNVVKPSEATWNIGNTSGDESFDYLFDPDKPHDGKASYKDVKGLFRLGEDGYYYFDSKQTFAELNVNQNGLKYDNGNNKITLYDTTWSTTGSVVNGEFFPFNHWNKLFTIGNDGNLEQIHPGLRPGDNKQGGQNHEGSDEFINHYFGMTMETKFQQPINGTINRGTISDVPMTFEFSGDDDIWIFIDDVLVGDLGGLHNAARIVIDFSTGKISYYGDIEGSTGMNHVNEGVEITHMSTYIKDIFDNVEGAPSLEWRGKTFANGTNHVLKFYYLERGNDLSNNSLKFNLEFVMGDSIYKVDENGNALTSAKFSMHEATIKESAQNKLFPEANDFITGNLIVDDIHANSSGIYPLRDADGEELDFSAKGDNKYYILREIETPSGYRENPDIILQYHQNTNTFTVVNKYETGAYPSFLANWIQINDVNYAIYDITNGKLSNSNSDIPIEDLSGGLGIVVPAIKNTDNDGNFLRWVPMYGSNTNGWHSVSDSYQGMNSSDNSQSKFEMDLALAAFLQIVSEDTEQWYLTWDNVTEKFNGYMKDLPGDATRYVVNNEDGDLTLITLFLSSDILESLGVENPEDYSMSGRYLKLKEVLSKNIGSISESNAYEYLNSIYNDVEHNPFNIIYSDEFKRTYRTIIYVPNEQRELRVRKVDSEGNALNGALFALFDDKEAALNFSAEGYDSRDNAISALNSNSNCVSYGITGTIDNYDGMLIFRSKDTISDGYGRMYWPLNNSANEVYWLKEIYAPFGYSVNPNICRIDVGNSGIYANATGFDNDGNMLSEEDGIKVYASLGKLSQTLVKYAIDNNVDVTLSCITIEKQIKDDIVDEWTNSSDIFDLHYGITNSKLLGQYEFHTQQDYLPEFKTENGYIRVMPRQNQNLSKDNSHQTDARRDILVDNDGPISLAALFSLLNTVEFYDEETKPSLQITKIVPQENIEEVAGDIYNFDIYIHKNNTPVAGSFFGYMHDTNHKVDGKSCVRKDHESIVFTLNDEGKTTISIPAGKTFVIYGLPEGSIYEITERIESAKGNLYQTYIDVDRAIGEIEKTLFGSTEPIVNERTVTGSLNTKKNNEGIIPAVGLEYTNVILVPHNLTIRKTVTGSLGDTEKEWAFSFIITNYDETLTSSYNYEIRNISNVLIQQGTVQLIKQSDDSYMGTIDGENIKLISGQSIIIKDLPNGISYKVREIEANQDDYVTKVNGNLGEEISGKLYTDTIIDYENNKDAFDLTLKKEVTGNIGSKTESFSFTIEFKKGTEFLQEVQYTKGEDSGIYTLNNGKIIVNLTSGENIVFHNLISGTQYIITEENNNYIVSVQTDGDGKITENKITGEMNDDIFVKYINTLNSTIPIGINISILPFILIICSGLVFFIVKRKKTKN